MDATPTLVIGLGNPILGDDGVGWIVAERVLHESEQAGLPVEVDRLSLGGLSLMERLVGYQRAILIDSLCATRLPTGTVHCFPLAELEDPGAGHSASVHDASLMTALETGRRLGLRLPVWIQVVAVAIDPADTFSEQLSPVVAAAVPVAVDCTLELLQSIPVQEPEVIT